MRACTIRIALTILCLTGSFSAANLVSAQQPIAKDDWPFGHEGINLLIQEMGFKLCGLSEWSRLPQDRKFMILLDHTGWQPIYRNTPALFSTGNGTGFSVQVRPLAERGHVSPRQTDDYFNSVDCPMVRPNTNHPIFDGVDRIVCNRPGYLSRIGNGFSADQFQRYPKVGRQQNKYPFAVVENNRRLAVIADPNVFSNQMLFKGDNLHFAENVLNWLSEDMQRQNILLMVQGRPQYPISEADLEIETPLPTQEEVLAALRDVPINEMLELANSLAATAEDSQMLNDLAHSFTDDLRPKAVNRIILLVLFAVCCMFAMATYFWQRKVLRRTSGDVMAKRRRVSLKNQADPGDAERQAAASMVLNAFCLDVANRRLADWADFPAPLGLDGRSVGQQTYHEMADMFSTLKTKPPSYWTQTRLLDLESTVKQWRSLMVAADQAIPVQPPVSAVP